MFKRICVFIIILFVILFSNSCTSTNNDADIVIKDKLTNIERNNSIKEPSEAFIKANNEFAYKTFADIMDDYKRQEISYLQGNNLIYSPYSFYRALSLLAQHSDIDTGFMQSIPIIPYSDIGGLNNIKSADIAIFNMNYYEELESANNLFLTDFPNGASKLSILFQKHFLSEVLLEPNYEENTSAVFLNATRFMGLWANPFDKNSNTQDKFYPLSAEAIDCEFMNCRVEGNTGFSDDKLAMTCKRLIKQKDGANTSKLYVIVPNTMDKTDEEARRLIADIGKNIQYYLKQDLNGYDSVYLKMPKLKLKSKLDLLELCDKHGYGTSDSYSVNGRLVKSKTDTPRKIGAVTQATTLQIDEEKVEAKAVTEIKEELMAIPELTVPKKLNVIADRPFFVIITSLSSEHIDEAITFIALINKP